MGQYSWSGGYLQGRLGFTNQDNVTEVWDEARNDFIEELFSSGYTSPFAIRTSDLSIVFQLRSGQIKYQSFVGAMQALLRAASDQRWVIEPIVRKVSFATWRTSVERVNRLAFTLQEPNPNYKGRPLLQQAIEEAAASQINLVLRTDAAQLEGLDTDAAIVRQAVDHVERHYGTLKAEGQRTEDGHLRTVRFDSQHGETDAATVSANPQTGEVAYETLTEELAERPVEDAQNGE